MQKTEGKAKPKSGKTRIMRDKSIKREILFHGLPASPGIAIGKVLLADPGKSELTPEDHVPEMIPADQVEKETTMFKAALEKTRNDIQVLRDQVRATMDAGNAGIFDAQFLIVEDRMLMKEVFETISGKHFSAESAFRQTITKYIAAISAIQDPYLQERAADIKDVAERILGNIRGQQKSILSSLPGPRIVVAHDLTPSDTASMDRSHVLAFATESGSKTAHSAILARSMKIPAIVGMTRFYERLEDGDTLIIDGFLGTAILNPNPETILLYEKKEKSKLRLYQEYLQETELKAETLDGFRVELSANIESTKNIDEVKKLGAAGVGLFRTEYLFMNRNDLPTEEEQFEVYKTVAESLAGRPAIIRTLDLGGDKLSSVLNTQKEQNPFLGLRAVRLCLAHPEILRTQMRAILRAGAFGKLRIMFPMVSGMQELDKLLQLLSDVKRELQKTNQKFDGGIEVGIMIEIPSAALIADRLARKVDFFSIGTNDLVQYTIAVDRNNEQVSDLYCPLHPAVLDLIARTVEAASRNGIWVGVCGESAADPLCIPILVGLGVKELSVSPISIGQTRRLIRKINMFEAEQLAADGLAASSPADTAAMCKKYVEEHFPSCLHS